MRQKKTRECIIVVNKGMPSSIIISSIFSLLSYPFSSFFSSLLTSSPLLISSLFLFLSHFHYSLLSPSPPLPYSIFLFFLSLFFFMEDQFVVRLPESIKEKVNEDVREGEFEKISIKMISSKEGILTYEGKTYSGYITDLPCILESHKTLDNRQFIKIADISKIFVFVDDGTNLQKKVEESSLSGITPPMAYVRNRRFRKRLTKAPIIEEIEKAVSDLLQKDQDALRVDVQVINKDGNESEEDVSSLAAEIELNLLESEKTPQIEPHRVNEELTQKEEELKEILIRLQEKKKEIEKITNPILKRRFQEGILQLEQTRDKIEQEIHSMTKDTEDAM